MVRAAHLPRRSCPALARSPVVPVIWLALSLFAFPTRSQVTSSLNTMVLRSVGASSATCQASVPCSRLCQHNPTTYSPPRMWIFSGSTLSGTSPNRWLKTSSTTMLVLFHTYTLSIATVGTSAISVLRNALAMLASSPTKSNSMRSGESLVILVCSDDWKRSKDHVWSDECGVLCGKCGEDVAPILSGRTCTRREASTMLLAVDNEVSGKFSERVSSRSRHVRRMPDKKRRRAQRTTCSRR